MIDVSLEMEKENCGFCKYLYISEPLRDKIICDEKSQVETRSSVKLELLRNLFMTK